MRVIGIVETMADKTGFTSKKKYTVLKMAGISFAEV
jgi:hypothetical protein